MARQKPEYTSDDLVGRYPRCTRCGATDNQGRVDQAAEERCREFLRSETSFAFNATNTICQSRGKWIDLFAGYNARIEIVYVEPPFETVLRQNQSRIRAVPEAVVRPFADKYEPPTWIECHSLVLTDGKELWSEVQP